MFSAREKWILLILAMVQFCNVVDFMIIMPLGPQLMRVFDLSSGEFGNVISVYTLGAAIAGLAGSFVLDRFDRKHVLIGLSIVFALGNAACALAPTYFYLLVARALTGAAGGILAATVLAVIGDTFSLKVRGRATGTVMVALSIGTIVGVPMGIFLAADSGWHMPFYYLAAAMLFVTLAVIFKFPSISGHLHKAERESRLVVLEQIISRRETLIPLIMNFIVFFSAFLVVPYISPSLVANSGFSEKDLAIVYLVGGITTFFSNPIMGRLVDQLSAKKLLYITMPAVIPAYILITHLGVVSKTFIAFAAIFLFLTSSARNVPLTAYMTTLVPPERRGSFMSILSSSQQFSMSLASFTAGHILVRTSAGNLINFERVGYLAVGASLLSTWLVRFSPKSTE